MLSRRFAVVVTIVVVFAFIVVSVAPAFAAAAGALPMHARLVSSSPGDASTVETATQVVLEFSEVVNPSFVAVRVGGAGGAKAEGAPVVDGREVTQALAADVPTGQHTVTYRVVSADGHPISGTVTFTTTATPGGAGTASPTDPASTSPSGSASPTATASAPSPGTPSGSSTAEAAPTASTDGGGPSWPGLMLGVAVLAAVALGLWHRRNTRLHPARAGE